MEERDHRMPIRILLVEEHGLLRTSLARLLSLEDDFEVAGEFGSSTEALEILPRSSVDIVLLDFGLGLDHANDFISAAKEAGYRGRCLMISAAADPSTAALAFKFGASGVFLKSDPPERLLQAIRLVHSGAVWIDQKTVQTLAEQCVNSPLWISQHEPLTQLDDREQRVLLGILRGQTNRKIGNKLGLAESSIKNILQGIFGRTGVRKRSQLVRLAMEGSLGDFVPPQDRPRKVKPKIATAAPTSHNLKELAGPQSIG